MANNQLKNIIASLEKSMLEGFGMESIALETTKHHNLITGQTINFTKRPSEGLKKTKDPGSLGNLGRLEANQRQAAGPGLRH